VCCDEWGDEYLVAFSYKSRGAHPSRNTRRMAEAAAYLSDQVSRRLPMRQWLLPVPKCLRHYLQLDEGALNAALRFFLWLV
jgi:hypothetical protein